MNAKALICTKDQKFSIQEVTLSDLGSQDVLVRTHYSGVSVGTEFALVRNKLSWGPFPISTGYQGVGVIEQVGEGVSNFQSGQTVYYRTQKAFTLLDGTAVSPTCGVHCSHAVIGPSETHGPALLPEGVHEEAASLFVMPSVALHGVDMAGIQAGDVAVVQGVGMIGLGSVATAMLHGAEVIAIDTNPKRLEMAKQFGAVHCINAADANVVEAVQSIVPEGADVVIEATGIGGLLDQAVLITRKYGKLVFQGNYGAGQMGLDFLPVHRRQLQTFFPCDDGYAPCRQAVMRMMRTGSLPFEKTITHRIPANESSAFMDRINRNQADDVLGVVIVWE